MNFTQYIEIHICMRILFLCIICKLLPCWYFLVESTCILFTACRSHFFTCSICFRWDKAWFDSAGKTGRCYCGGWWHGWVSLLRWWVKATVSVVPIWWSPHRLHPDKWRPDHSQHPALWRRSIHLYSHCSDGRTRHGYHHYHCQPRGHWWVFTVGGGFYAAMKRSQILLW